MPASFPTRKSFTPGRVLFGVLIVLNVGLVVVLLQSSRRTARLEKRLDQGTDPAAAPERSAPASRAARRAGQEDVGVRRPPGEDEQPAPAGPPPGGSRRPPDDPEEAFDRLVSLAQPNPTQERVMREAFDRLHPKAVAAYHAGDEAKSKEAWWEYCDEVGEALDEPTLNRMGCRRTEPLPPSPAEMRGATKPPPGPELQQRGKPPSPAPDQPPQPPPVREPQPAAP